MKNLVRLIINIVWLVLVAAGYFLFASSYGAEAYTNPYLYILIFILSLCWILGSWIAELKPASRWKKHVADALCLIIGAPVIIVFGILLGFASDIYIYKPVWELMLVDKSLILDEIWYMLLTNWRLIAIGMCVYVLGRLQLGEGLLCSVFPCLAKKDKKEHDHGEDCDCGCCHSHCNDCTAEGDSLTLPAEIGEYFADKDLMALCIDDELVAIYTKELYSGFMGKLKSDPENPDEAVASFLEAAEEAVELRLQDGKIPLSVFDAWNIDLGSGVVTAERKGDILMISVEGNGHDHRPAYMVEYEKWVSSPALSDAERQELLDIAGDEKEIESRFFAPLSFGTAGLRGVLGMGINRMNIYTVRQATQGIASLIKGMGKDACERGVAIAMDCRIMSDEFAREAACVLAGNGIKTYLFESLRPTPELSFAVRSIGCIAGINITASHNPKEYNGYKAYWEDGAQLPPAEADVVAREIAKTDIFTGVVSMDYAKAVKKGIITLIGEEVDESFLFHAEKMCINRDEVEKAADDFKIVYTPFHGTGHKLVPEILRRIGLKNIICVPEQMVIDGSFPTVVSPNPENKEGFTRAIEIAKEENVDLIIGTDPDADRVGVIVRDTRGEFIPITGNQMGVLLLDYIIKARKETGTMPEKPAAIKTIVTTEMIRKVGEVHGVEVFNTFTGFKFMAEKIKGFEQDKSYEYLLAFEESYGYLVGGYCRDKDAVTASMLIAEMAAYYHNRGKSLYDALQDLYEQYGYYSEMTVNIVMPGVDGLSRMAELMNSLRNTPPKSVSGTAVLRVRDYQSGEITDLSDNSTEKMELSGSNVLYFELSDGTAFIIRPSGTEPKIKVYILAQGDTAEQCAQRVELYTKAAQELGK